MITGGAGFTGSHVASALVVRGDDVVVLDDLSAGGRANVEQLATSGSAELTEDSVTDAELVNELMARCDCYLHLPSDPAPAHSDPAPPHSDPAPPHSDPAPRTAIPRPCSAR